MRLFLLCALLAMSAVANAKAVTDRFFGMHFSSAKFQPWPTSHFSILRTWDQYPGVAWAGINTADGVYDWTELDEVVADAVAQGVDIVYTFGVTPAWASSNPTGQFCQYGDGTCFAPVTAKWEAFVTAITERYDGQIKYWEIWNEPNASNFWQGTTAEMVTMAQSAYSIIKAANPCNVVVSPSPQGSSAQTWLASYFTAGGDDYTDIISFHAYLYPYGPGYITTLVDNVRGVVDDYPVLANKPIWDGEHSWGDPAWIFGTDPDQQAAWLARFITLSAWKGVDRSIWYMWDGYDGQAQHGMLYNRTTNQFTVAGVAYDNVYNWLINADIDSCTLTSNVYQCHLNRVNNYEGLIVWAESDTPSFTASFSVPAGYTKYKKLDGTTTTTAAGASLTLTMKPILLEK